MIKKVFFVFSLFVYSGIVYAGGLSCSKDGRPVDGFLQVLTLAPNLNGTFDVLYSTQSLREEKPTQVLLARRLSCVASKKDGRVVSCQRSSTRAEPVNSGVESKKVTERGVRAVSLPNGVDSVQAEDYTRKLLTLSIYSPEVKELRGSAGWRRNFEFELEQCQALE